MQIQNIVTGASTPRASVRLYPLGFTAAPFLSGLVALRTASFEASGIYVERSAVPRRHSPARVAWVTWAHRAKHPISAYGEDQETAFKADGMCWCRHQKPQASALIAPRVPRLAVAAVDGRQQPPLPPPAFTGNRSLVPRRSDEAPLSREPASSEIKGTYNGSFAPCRTPCPLTSTPVLRRPFYTLR